MDLEPDWNLFQIHAELPLAAMAASPATFLRDLHPAPSLEKNELNELHTKPQAPTSYGMQWTFHPLVIITFINALPPLMIGIIINENDDKYGLPI